MNYQTLIYLFKGMNNSTIELKKERLGSLEEQVRFSEAQFWIP